MASLAGSSNIARVAHERREHRGQDWEKRVTAERLVRRLVIGVAAGYAASRCMDIATSAFYERQSDASKAREEQVFPGGAIIAAGRDMAMMMKIDADEGQIERLGLIAHRGVAVLYGAVAASLVGIGVRPFRAGVLTAGAAFVLVDEALNAVQLEPSPLDFPIEAHLRGLVGHATFGVVLGAVLTAARGVLCQDACPVRPSSRHRLSAVRSPFANSSAQT